ncbi:MAG: VOC family protein [Actinobacteria bacterium]|nr:VOC family protein [Actinomycetota bacterium]
MQIRSLDHIVLTCADPEATVAFYERVGMQREEFGGGRLALRFGDQKINLHQAGAEFQPHAAMPLPGTGDLCLIVDGSIEAVVAHLGEVGIAIEEGPVDRTGAVGSLRSVYVRDPDGNLVEFAEQV